MRGEGRGGDRRGRGGKEEEREGRREERGGEALAVEPSHFSTGSDATAQYGIYNSATNQTKNGAKME